MGAYRDAVNADGAYIHWELNGSWNDSEGVATTTGTQYGGSSMPTNTTTPVKGQTAANGCYEFDTGDGGVLVGTAAQAQAALGANLDDNNALTFECWYQPMSILGGVRTSGTNNLIRSDNGWWLRVTNQKVSMAVRKSTAFDTSYADTTTSLVNESLYHIVGTWDGTYIRIYVNGALVSTSSSLAGTLSFPSNNATYIGSPGGETANGYVDEVAIYRSALSLATIQSHYAIGTGGAIVAGTVTDVDVAGQPATVVIPVDATINAEVTDTDATGQPATVTAVSSLQRLTTTQQTLEGSSAGWYNQVNATHGVVGGDGHTGSDAGHLTSVASGDMSIATMTNDDAPTTAPTITAGTLYQASVWVKAASAARNVTISIKYYDSGGSLLDTVTSASAADNTSTYTRYEVIGTAPANTVYGAIFINVAGTGAGGEAHYFDTASLAEVLPSTNVGIDGIDATVTVASNATVTAVVTNVAINGHDATVTAEGETINNAEVTNTAIAGQPATIAAAGNVSVGVTLSNTTISAPDPIMSSGQLHVEVEAEVADTLVAGKIATVASWALTTFTETSFNGTIYSWATNSASSGNAVYDTLKARAQNHTGNDVTNTQSVSINVPSGILSPTITVNYSWDVLRLANVARIVWNGVQQSAKSATTDGTYNSGSSSFVKSVTAGSAHTLRTEFSNNWDSYPPSFEWSTIDSVVLSYSMQVQQPGAPIEIGSGTSPDVDVAGQPATVVAGVSVSVTAELSDSDVTGSTANVLTPGTVSLGHTATNVAVTGYAPTITLTRDVTQNTIPTNIAAAAHSAIVRTAEDSFKFIPIDDSSLTSVDAAELVSINLGALLYSQEKFAAFKLGNTANNPIDITVSIQSTNDDFSEIAQLSTDKVNYSSTIELNAIAPNAVTDPIWIRVSAAAISPGAGTILVNVEQANA